MTEAVYGPDIGKQMMSDAKFYMGYSRWQEDLGRYETWDESVSRVMNMHRKKYDTIMSPELEAHIKYAEDAYKDKLILGSQRALQFGGDQIFKHESRIYNCATSYCDRPAFFGEAMYLLLSGCGVGFSVQRHHIGKLEQIARRSQKKVKVFHVPDTIEGWADSFSVLLSSYFVDGGLFPEYKGCQVHFDFTKIRPKGALISGGFLAPGPDGLRVALTRCEDLIENVLKVAPITRLDSITCYDFVMHMSDAVLSGGVRRSATICMFDRDDELMLTAKTGNWFAKNPQRARSNNSAVIIRDDITRDQWREVFGNVKEFGEPGFIFSDSTEFMFNPCVEAGMLPVTEDGESGWQFCNLVEINGAKCTDMDAFTRACKAASIVATLQAGYTNFKYLTEASKRITDREALTGVSITGWTNNPDILFDPENMREGATLIKTVNRALADLLGINPSARTTCGKPSGNASVLLGTASGIHAEHSPRYIRHIQMNELDGVLKAISTTNPMMVEKSIYSANGTDFLVGFPIEPAKGSIMKKDLLGVKQLEKVKIALENWVQYGKATEFCVDPRLSHNISNTITVDNWDEVEQYLYDNRHWFAGVSLMPLVGEKAYAQAPFTEVFTHEEIVSNYGIGALFGSGLVVDGLHAFNENLWMACATLEGFGEDLTEDSKDLLKRDWVRRARKFATNYFGGDIQQMTNCLKDLYNLHKWESITRTIKPVDFVSALTNAKFTDVDTMGSQACAGGACDLTY